MPRAAIAVPFAFAQGNKKAKTIIPAKGPDAAAYKAMKNLAADPMYGTNRPKRVIIVPLAAARAAMTSVVLLSGILKYGDTMSTYKTAA